MYRSCISNNFTIFSLAFLHILSKHFRRKITDTHIPDTKFIGISHTAQIV